VPSTHRIAAIPSARARGLLEIRVVPTPNSGMRCSANTTCNGLTLSDRPLPQDQFQVRSTLFHDHCNFLNLTPSGSPFPSGRSGRDRWTEPGRGICDSAVGGNRRSHLDDISTSRSNYKTFLPVRLLTEDRTGLGQGKASAWGAVRGQVEEIDIGCVD